MACNSFVFETKALEKQRRQGRMATMTVSFEKDHE